MRKLAVLATVALVAALTVVLLVPGAESQGTVSAHEHDLRVDKREEFLEVKHSSATKNVTCNDANDYVLAGSVRVDNVDSPGQAHQVETRTSIGVDAKTWKFTLLNHSGGRAQTKLFVTCVSPKTTGGLRAQHDLILSGAIERTLDFHAGVVHVQRQHCNPTEQLPVAPGITSGDFVQLRASVPGIEGWHWNTQAGPAQKATFSLRCLRDRLTTADAHSHHVYMDDMMRLENLTVSTAIQQYAIECPSGHDAVVPLFELGTGVVLIGSEPQGQRWVFRLQNRGSASAAYVGAICLKKKTGGVL